MGQGLALVGPRKEGLVKTQQLGRLKKVGQGLALAEPKLPKGSFETLNRDMTGQVGVEPSSLEGQRNCGKGWA